MNVFMTPTKFSPRFWVLALVLSGCASGADVTTAEPTTTTRVLATTTTTTTTIPQPVVPESVEYIIGEQGRATNVPGTYQVLFDPPFVMTLPDDWTADVLNDHYAYFRWAGSGFGLGDQPLVAVQIFDSLVEPDDPEQSLETPANLIRYIESHPGMLTQAPENVVVAGTAGRSIDFQIIQLDEDGNQVRVEFGRSGDDIAVGFDAQWDVRFITLGVEGVTVVITVEVPCCHRLDDFMYEADKLIDSIVFASVAAPSQQTISDEGAWTRVPNDAEGRDHGVFGSVIEGGDGLVAGGWSDDGLIWTSADGQSWRPVLGPVDSDLVNGIFPAADGLVAVGTRITENDGTLEYDGVMWESADGLDWSETRPPQDIDMLVEYVDDVIGGPMAVGFDVEGPRAVFGLSEDGAWRPLLVDKRFQSVHPVALVATPVGTLLVGYDYDASYLWLNADGERWVLVAQFEGAVVQDALVADDVIVMVGAAADPARQSSEPNVPRVWMSYNAHEWEEIDPGGPRGAYMVDIALSGDGTLMATGRDLDREVPALWMSIDGQTWDLYEVDASLAQACGCTEIIGVAPMGEGAVLVGYDTSSGHEQPAVMVWSSQ